MYYIDCVLHISCHFDLINLNVDVRLSLGCLLLWILPDVKHFSIDFKYVLSILFFGPPFFLGIINTIES